MSTIVDAGVDYITLHTPEWGCYRNASIEEVLNLYQQFAGSSVLILPKRRLGYDGMGDDHIFVGEREDGYIREIKSGFAEVLYEYVVLQSDKPSRLDLQVTIRTQFDPVEQINLHEQEATTANLLLPIKRQRTIENISDNKGGRTLYVGSRESNQFGRLYSKYAKSKEDRYKGAVRYEVEFKNEHAHAIAIRLPTDRQSRYKVTISIVKEWLSSRGVFVPLDMRGLTNDLPKPVLPTSNVDSTMNWLKTQVAPAIKRISPIIDNERILDALGLEVLPTPSEVLHKKEGQS